MATERCRNRQSTGAVMPLTFSSPFGLPFSRAGGFRGACPCRGFLFAAFRAAGNNTAGQGSPGAPSPGTTFHNDCSMPRVHGATLRR